MTPRNSIDILPGVVDLQLPRIDDERGGLDKFFDPTIGDAIGRPVAWRQVLRSRTAKANTLRGLHCQLPPHSEAKLIAPLAGRMFWVSVDLRKASASFGRWCSRTLDAAIPNALFVERGFGHGCLSLSDEVELLILADNDYHPPSGVGIAWDDAELAIEWPRMPEAPLLSGEHAGFLDFGTFRQRHHGL
jgi:dTDP-4-dehydrorhamnose 3,5-epimerase